MKARWILGLVTMVLSAGMVLAQPGGQGGQGGEGGRDGQRRGGPGGMRGGPGGMRGGMMMGGMRGGPFGGMDKNDNMLIEEEELAEALTLMQERLNKLKPFVMEEFDVDKDGKLSEEEDRECQGFFRSLGMVGRFDADKDWNVSEAELDEAWQQLAEGCQRYNDMLLERLDKNQDGAISEAERDEARKAWEERMAQWRQRRE